MSIKVSDFAGILSVDDNGLLNVVQNGQNFKIAQSDYFKQFGTTGSIVQEGDPAATPVLDVAGTVNNIRNFSDGAGVKFSVNAQNGVTGAHNFTVDSVGAPLMLNKTLLSPTFVSLLGSDTITVSQVGNQIKFDVTGEAGASTTVVIAEESDFPAAVSGVITLEPRTDYLVIANITTANRFVLSNDTLLRSVDSSQVDLIYTGTGTMLTSVDASNKISRITLACATGTLADISSTTGQHIFQMVDMTVTTCDKIGTFDSLFATQLSDVAFLNIVSDGASFTGTHGLFIAQTDLSIIEAGSLFNLGTATFNTFSYGTSQVTLNGTSTMLTGATGSANILAGGLGTIINTRIQGAGTPLSGISTDDALWQFELNDDIADTRTDGLLSMQGNAVATTITTQSVGVLVAGTWVIEDTGQMTGTTAGRLTNDAGKLAKLPITSSVTIVPVSGGSQTMGLAIAVNGTMVANSLRTANASAGVPTAITVPWQENLAPGDFVELFVSNESGITNVLVSSGVHRVN